MNVMQVAVIAFFISLAMKTGGTAPIELPGVTEVEAYINPLPHALMLTAIVVGVSPTGVALALVGSHLSLLRHLGRTRAARKDARMIQHAPVLIFIVPLVAALIVPLIALRTVAWARTITLAALLGVIACSGTALTRALATGPLHYELGGWAPPWGIVYVLDPLSGGMALLIGIIAALVAVYTQPYLSSWPTSRTGYF